MTYLQFPVVVRGYAWPVRCLAVLVLLAVMAGVSFAGEIKLDASQIPPAPGLLKRLKLTPSKAPKDFVQQILATVAPGAKLESLSRSEFAKQHGLKVAQDIQAALDHDRVVALLDEHKGHVDVFPSLDKLPPMAKSDGKNTPPIPKGKADAAKRVAENVLKRGTFEKDAHSKPVLEEMLTLNASQFHRAPGGGPDIEDKDKSGPILATFPVKRLVDNLPVSGRGSHGVINVGDDGKVHGFSKHWQTADDYDQVNDDRTPAQIMGLIKQQLADLASKGPVEVFDVHLAYYDGDGDYLQPVYEFHAKYSITPPAGKKQEANDGYLVGYVPYGTTPAAEHIPDLRDKPGVGPQVASLDDTLVNVADASDTLGNSDVPPANDPWVGRYVVRNDYSGWVNSANKFWNGLQASGYGGNFTNKQYYWAYPNQIEGSKNSYVNSVHVADIEGHGDWWIWSTLSNCCDVVRVDDIPSPGLGGSAGGRLAYLIIHSCEVVPSAADTASWPTKWWHVFGGLHSVFGYRTIMYIDDGVMYPFGIHMAQGANLVSAWLNDVVGSSMYTGSNGTTMHGTWKPYGRPSTISVCGHDGDSVYSTYNLGPATCLVNHWYY